VFLRGKIGTYWLCLCLLMGGPDSFSPGARATSFLFNKDCYPVFDTVNGGRGNVARSASASNMYMLWRCILLFAATVLTAKG
jgi:hypothetical protein